MKITQEQQKKGEELYQQLVEKAWDDANFKERLISSPTEAIEAFTNNEISIPKDDSIVVEDQTNDSIIYLNIPRKINLDNMELNDKQIELIAGGWCVTGRGLGYDIGYNFGEWYKGVMGIK